MLMLLDGPNNNLDFSVGVEIRGMCCSGTGMVLKCSFAVAFLLLLKRCSNLLVICGIRSHSNQK